MLSQNQISDTSFIQWIPVKMILRLFAKNEAFSTEKTLDQVPEQ
jgi:hypothetical protein